MQGTNSQPFVREQSEAVMTWEYSPSRRSWDFGDFFGFMMIFGIPLLSLLWILVSATGVIDSKEPSPRSPSEQRYDALEDEEWDRRVDAGWGG